MSLLHVVATELLKEAIVKGTELGKKAKDILYKGEAVPDEVMLKLLEDKMKSPEVAHYGWHFLCLYQRLTLKTGFGYLLMLVVHLPSNTLLFHLGFILDGFPILSEDFMSIRDQIGLIKNWPLQPDFIINMKVSLLLSYLS